MQITRKMKWIFLFSIGVTISSCCYIPLVDCGPKIVKLNVSAANLDVDIDKNISFSSWQYYSRGADEPLLLNLHCKVLKRDSILIEDASFLINDGLPIKPKEIVLLAEENVEGFITQTFNIEFFKCCKSYPLEVSLDSIPIVMSADTSYSSLSVKITK